MMRTWWIAPGDNEKVMRGDEVIATITTMKSGNYRWDGMNMYRENFLMKDHILEDVKYFYRYPHRRKTVITFKSGRKVVL